MTRLLLLATVGLAACQPGSGYTDDPHEGYVDPGPNEIAQALERGAENALDAADQPAALRALRIWQHQEDTLWLYVEEPA